jgi:hypothetical protein
MKANAKANAKAKVNVLDIEKYDLDDILKLFKLERNFDEKDLKNAKKIVLLTHPDKSGLHPDYFRFYSNAYKIIFEIWEFKNKSEKTEKANDLFDMSESQKSVLDKTIKTKKTSKKFNEWFNNEFDKMNVITNEDETGYGNWLKSEDDISLSNDANELDKKKRQLRENELMVYKNVNEMCFNNGSSNLAGDAPETYSSDVFSNLKYEDLHRAHTESVIPVTMDDFYNVKKFNSVDEYKRHRSEALITSQVLSDIQANEYLKHKTKMEDEYSTNRAYKLAKQSEQFRANQQVFWGNLMKLEN